MEDLLGCGGWSRRRALHNGPDGRSGTPEDRLDPRHDAARIRAMFVHPDWARRGIGWQILTVCEAAARDAGFRGLELLATRTGERLYASAGFRLMERVEMRLPDGVVLPLARMGKALADEAGAGEVYRAAGGPWLRWSGPL